jgi:hypothetical protein
MEGHLLEPRDVRVSGRSSDSCRLSRRLLHRAELLLCCTRFLRATFGQQDTSPPGAHLLFVVTANRIL